MHSTGRSFYQYALLNLAILQADFGCYSEAVSAMQEAIAIARESHDMNCLNFCMSWLYHFGKAFPGEMKDVQNTGMLGSEKEGLAFLKAKAKETEMWSLLSTMQLSEAKLELQNVSRHRGGRWLFLTGSRERAWPLSSRISSKPLILVSLRI
jgi:anaphase-promoting complex subunit 5